MEIDRIHNISVDMGIKNKFGWEWLLFILHKGARYWRKIRQFVSGVTVLKYGASGKAYTKNNSVSKSKKSIKQEGMAQEYHTPNKKKKMPLKSGKQACSHFCINNSCLFQMAPQCT